MTSKLLTVTAAAALIATPALGEAWINEFHYDNSGTDVGEFVEIVVSDDIDIATITVTLYNGSGGAPYGSALTSASSTFNVGDSQDGYTFYYWLLPSNGIQNGPDGFSLDVLGDVSEFISYEGTTITGVGGPADGLESFNVGVTEGSGTPIGSSLGLTGEIGSFTWTVFDDVALLGSGAATPGSINGGQSLIPAPGALALLGIAGLARRRRRA